MPILVFALPVFLALTLIVVVVGEGGGGAMLALPGELGFVGDVRRPGAVSAQRASAAIIAVGFDTPVGQHLMCAAPLVDITVDTPVARACTQLQGVDR